MAVSNRHNARRAAVQALYQWELTAQAADEIQTQFEKIHNLQNVDKRYLREITREVPKLDTQLQVALEPHLDRPFSQLDPVEKAILRLGAWELTYRTDVPTRVVLNETIELAKVFGAEHSYKYINGVMDKLAGVVRGDSRQEAGS